MNIEGLWKYDKLIKAYELEVKHNMELEQEYDQLLQELDSYKEKISDLRQDLAHDDKQIHDLRKELKKLKETCYVWDFTRREWLPESGTLQQIQRHVAFPLIAKVGGEIHES